MPTSHSSPLKIPLLSCSFSSATSLSDSDQWRLYAAETSRPIGRPNMSSPSWYLPQFLRLANYLTLKLICALNGAESDKRHHVFRVSWRWLMGQKHFSCGRVGAVQRNVPSVNTATRINCLIVWTTVTVHYSTVLHVSRNSIALWKDPRFRPFVFLVRATCRWSWDWNIGGMILRGGLTNGWNSFT